MCKDSEGQGKVSLTMKLSGIEFSNLDKSCEETQTLELSLSQNKFVDLQKLSTEITLRKAR